VLWSIRDNGYVFVDVFMNMFIQVCAITQVFNDPSKFQTDMQGKISLQESFNTDSKYKSFSWKILRQAMEVFGAKTYVGETALTEGQFNESNVVH